MPRLTKNRYNLKGSFKDSDKNEYAAGDDLVLWVDFTSGTPTDKAQLEDTPTLTYEGSVSVTNDSLSNDVNNINKFNIARFDNSENLNALATYSSTTNSTSLRP